MYVTHRELSVLEEELSMEMPRNLPEVVAVGSVSQLVGVLAMWVRLHWRERHEQAHRDYLVAVAGALPPGSALDEQQGDGYRVHLVISHSAVRGDLRG